MINILGAVVAGIAGTIVMTMVMVVCDGDSACHSHGHYIQEDPLQG